MQLEGPELLIRSPPFNMNMSQFYPPPILTIFPPYPYEAYLPVPERHDQGELALRFIFGPETSYTEVSRFPQSLQRNSRAVSQIRSMTVPFQIIYYLSSSWLVIVNMLQLRGSIPFVFLVFQRLTFLWVWTCLILTALTIRKTVLTGTSESVHLNFFTWGRKRIHFPKRRVQFCIFSEKRTWTNFRCYVKV